MFSKIRPNKRVVTTSRAVNENSHPRRNRFIRDSQGKAPNQKKKIFFFLKTVAILSIFLLINLTFIFVHDVLTQSKYFGIKKIDVTGVRHLTTKDVIMQTGVSKGDNLLKINLDLIRKQLLAHPWIEDAQVSRSIPDGLGINITEHLPEAIAEIKNERYLVSDKGVFFKSLTDSDPQEFPLITGLSYTDIPVADLPASTPFEAVREVLAMGRKSTAALQTRKIRRIATDSDMGLTLEAFEPPILIQIGYESYPQKYDNLKRILTYLQADNELSNVSAIDLSDLEQIVVTPVILEPPRQG